NTPDQFVLNGSAMKTDIHPDYVETSVRCSCGNTFTTRSTKPDLHVELCNECHPFYTGKQKLVDTGGRVERFERRYGRRGKKYIQSDRWAASLACGRSWRRCPSRRQPPPPKAATFDGPERAKRAAGG